MRDKLRKGELVLGSWINTGSPIVAELMAAVGFDFLTVDAEHSAVDLSRVQQLFQAIRSGNAGCAPFVRTPGHDYAQTKRYMDAGAVGVICPLINTADEALEVVNAVKYPPEGRRGVGFCRDNMYGTGLGDRVARANDDTVVCVQIEHIDGVGNIDDILSVKGIDAVMIGPYDLTASQGITGQFEHPDYLEARKGILEACRRHGVAPGLHVVEPDADQVAAAYREGFRLIGYSLDITMLAHCSEEGLNEIRKMTG